MRLLFVLAVVALLMFQEVAHADTFGGGKDTFHIEFVTIGDAGNGADTAGDPNPAGAVDYEYSIGKYEVSEQMINKANALSALDGNPLGITIDTRGPDKPATRASWFEAAQFVNWLNTSTGNTPAYKFDSSGVFQLWEPGDAGYDPNNRFRNTEAFYFLPSADEWYKAAFYDPASDTYFDFPNGSNTAPLPVASGTAPGTAVFDQPFEQGPADVKLAGGPSPFGIVGQAGNVWEWDESEGDLVNNDPQALRGLRGSAWLGGGSSDPMSLSSVDRYHALPWRSVGDVGFRVATIIPEPNTFWLIVSGVLANCLRRRSAHRI